MEKMRSRNIKLKIKDRNGEFEIEVTPTETATVLDMKQIIQVTRGVDPSFQELIYHGTSTLCFAAELIVDSFLENDFPLEACALNNGDTIMLCVYPESSCTFKINHLAKKPGTEMPRTGRPQPASPPGPSAGWLCG